jgi:hypothetical protein
MAGARGIEPRSPESKSDALPLCYTPLKFGGSGEIRTHCLPVMSRLPIPLMLQTHLVPKPRIELETHSYQECVIPFNYIGEIGPLAEDRTPNSRLKVWRY